MTVNNVFKGFFGFVLRKCLLNVNPSAAKECKFFSQHNAWKTLKQKNMQLYFVTIFLGCPLYVYIIFS